MTKSLTGFYNFNVDKKDDPPYIVKYLRESIQKTVAIWVSANVLVLHSKVRKPRSDTSASWHCGTVSGNTCGSMYCGAAHSVKRSSPPRRADTLCDDPGTADTAKCGA